MRTGDVIRYEEAIYLPPFYYSETGCAKRLLRLLETKSETKADAENIVKSVIQNAAIAYDEIQEEAIRTAVNSKVMVLTGGPGTGKTTTTMGIISALQMMGCQILLAAPTGRAAKRMAETTGMEAKTIHRLLEYKTVSYTHLETYEAAENIDLISTEGYVSTPVSYTHLDVYKRQEEGDTAYIGITDFAQDALGDLVFVNLPEVGDKVEVGEPFADVE